MRDYSKLFKRVQALVLTVAMILPVLNSGLLLNVSATDDVPNSQTEGQIVAENYELTDAEAALLSSGLLVGETHHIYAPDAEDGLVSVDEETKTITAESYEKEGYIWNAVSADIVVNGLSKENVTIADGKGTYAYEGNAFSVQVLYQVEVEVAEGTQEALLNAPGYLKQGIANLNAVYKADSDLSVIALALDMLEMLADGIKVSLGTATLTLKLGTDAATAVRALKVQADANGDNNLDLSIVSQEYEASAYKSQYLIQNSGSVKAKIDETYALVKAVNDASLFDNDLLYAYLESNDPTTYTQLMLLLGKMEAWLTAMDSAASAEWGITSTEVVKSEMSASEWAELDSLLASIDTVTDVSAIEIMNPLVADETRIQFNMQMYNVSVKVNLMVAGSDAATLVAKDQMTAVVTLAANASSADVLAAVAASSVEADAVAAWTEKGLYVDGQFDVVASELAAELTEDIEYVITYSPKYYTITYDYAISTTAPYGYQMVLPENTTTGKVYDYVVNGESYYQGDVITIKGATTIERTEGKAYDISASLNKVVSDVYFTAGDKSTAILTSGALNDGNQMITIRTPEDDCLSIEPKDGKLTANKYNSGYNGLMWVPTGYTLVGGDNDGETGTFVDGVAELAGKNYEQVAVTYELALNMDVLDLLNLPYILNEEAAGQVEALDRLVKYNDNLNQLNTTILGTLVDLINAEGTVLNSDPAKDAAIKADFTEVINGILNNCMDGKNLKLNVLLTEYSAQGLVYYYQNSAEVLDALNTLSTYLDALLETEEKQAALAKLMADNGFSQYTDKITTLQSAIADVKADLKAPNAAINTNSTKLGALVNALASVGTVKPYAELPKAFALTEELSITAPTKGSVVVTLTGGGKTFTVSQVYDLGYVMTENAVEALKKAVEQKANELALSDDFYTTTYDLSVLDQYVGHTIDGTAKTSFEWTAKTFTVVVPYMEDQIISINDLTIELAASPTFGLRYEYTIGSETGVVGTYTFSQDEVKSLFVNGSYTVSRTVIDVKEQNLIAFVNELNASIDNGSVKFVLIKNAGNYSIVMKINATQPNALMGAMQGMAMGFVQSDYAYIGLDENGVLENSKISLQAIIDAVMTSGFTSDDFVKALNADGSVNHMTLKGDVLAGDKNGLGGKLIATTMNVGNSLADSLELDFYITLGSAAGEIVKVRNLFAEQLNGYLKIVCDEGKSTMQLTLPGKAYEAYLAALLLTDNLDIRNINDVNAEIAMGFVKDFIDPMFTGDVTLATVMNTLEAFGYNIDLSNYEDIFAKVCDQYSITEIVYDEKTGTVTRTFSIKPVLDALNIPSALAGVIKEYETGITVSGAATLENLDTDYEALFVDVRAEGVTNKIGLTTNLAAKLGDLSGASVIVLMDDVSGDLVFNHTTVLNLNGFTVNGSIVSNGNLTIVDSTLTEDCGTVTGTVSGNVNILGGNYAMDVTEFLKEGYTQNNGKVGNEFYAFVKDANGDITIEIDAGIVNTNYIPDVKFMVLDLAVDMLFNGYTTNLLHINGHKVYEITMDDFVGIYTGEDRLNTLVHNIVNMVDSKELAAIANQLIADITDFEALQNAVLNDEALVAYTMTTGAWNVELQHVTEGDYLSIGVTAGNVKENRNLYVKLVGTEEEKAHIADVLGVLKDTTDVEITVDMNHGFATSDDKNLVLDWGATAYVNIDFSHNYDYAVMFSILLADGLDGTARDNLVSGIRAFYETGDIADLRAAFDALTTSQAITAVKNFARTDTITAMVNDLGIADVVADSVIELEQLLDKYGKVAAMALRQVESITGGNRTLGSFYKASLGGYGFTRSDLNKTFARDLVKGYSVTLNVEVTDILVCIDIFGDGAIVENTPVIEEVVIDDIHEDIAGVKIDGEYIFLDAHSNGLLADDLKALMGFVVTNGEIVSVEMSAATLVYTGSTITVTAQNPVSGETATLVLTVIVLGDVDCDGRATVKDANMMADHFVYGIELDQYQTLALDADWSGSFNVKDALVLADKFVYWDSYTSMLDA